MKLVGFQQPTCSGVRMEFVVGTISLSCELFRTAVFVHVGPAQLCTENVVLFYMCRAVEIAWLTQIIRHNSVSVRLRLVAFRCLHSPVDNNNARSCLMIFTSLCWV